MSVWIRPRNAIVWQFLWRWEAVVERGKKKKEAFPTGIRERMEMVDVEEAFWSRLPLRVCYSAQPTSFLAWVGMPSSMWALLPVLLSVPMPFSRDSAAWTAQRFGAGHPRLQVIGHSRHMHRQRRQFSVTFASPLGRAYLGMGVLRGTLAFIGPLPTLDNGS